MDVKPDPATTPLTADELAEDVKNAPHEVDAPPLTEAQEGSSAGSDAGDPAPRHKDGEAVIERGLTMLPPG